MSREMKSYHLLQHTITCRNSYRYASTYSSYVASRYYWCIEFGGKRCAMYGVYV